MKFSVACFFSQQLQSNQYARPLSSADRAFSEKQYRPLSCSTKHDHCLLPPTLAVYSVF